MKGDRKENLSGLCQRSRVMPPIGVSEPRDNALDLYVRTVSNRISWWRRGAPRGDESSYKENAWPLAAAHERA
jgi:hypothetical protein